MRIPRDVSGKNLAKALRAFDYEITRQTGSHIRLTTKRNGEHHVTVPAHENLRVGTLSNIVGQIANHLEMDRNELIEKLFE